MVGLQGLVGRYEIACDRHTFVVDGFGQWEKLQQLP